MVSNTMVSNTSCEILHLHPDWTVILLSLLSFATILQLPEMATIIIE